MGQLPGRQLAQALPGHLGHRDGQPHHRRRFRPAGRHRGAAAQPPVRQTGRRPKRVSWHQDASYWPLTPSRVVSAWLAINDTDVDNSAMQVVPGSHHHAKLTFRDSTAAENNVLFQTVDNAADYGDPPVALEMRAGQISLHSDWILHGSEPNGSNRRRCGLAMRYLSADVHAYDGWNAHSVWCRGTDPRNHWANHPRRRRVDPPQGRPLAAVRRWT